MVPETENPTDWCPPPLVKKIYNAATNATETTAATEKLNYTEKKLLPDHSTHSAADYGKLPNVQPHSTVCCF